MNRLKLFLAAFVVSVITMGLYSCAKDETLFKTSAKEQLILNESNFSDFIKLVENDMNKNKLFVDEFLVKSKLNKLEN